MAGVDEIERLRRLAFNQSGTDVPALDGADSWLEPALDLKTLALVRLGAIVGLGGCGVPSFGALTDAALDAGASITDVVDVLVGVRPIVGHARVVAAAPAVALALGHDTDELSTPPERH